MGEPEGAPSLREAMARIDTGHSWLFFAPNDVYKVKKPLMEPGRDFRSLAARQRACEREVRLNRPFSGATYRAVVPLYGTENDWSIVSQGDPVEFAVHMRRLPDERALSQLVARRGGHEVAPGLDTADLERLAELIVAFHQGSKSSERIAKAGEAAAIEGTLRSALKAAGEAEPDGLALEHLESALLEFLATRRELFEARISGNKVRDGHGDLRADHVFLTDPPVLLGRLEHSDRARHVDILDDVASLLVDLELRAGSEVAARCWGVLAPRLGERADEPLLEFYRALRALHRARHDGLGATVDPDSPPALELARACCRCFHRPRLIVTVGMMGAGKSTLAQALAQTMGVKRVSATDARQALFPTSDPKAPPVRLKREQIDQLYDRMCCDAERLLRAEVSVVLDADFLTKAQRARPLALAQRLGVEPLFLECRLSKSDAIARLDHRRKKDRTMPRGRPELYDEELARFEPTDDVPTGRLLPLGTRLPVPLLLDTVLKALPANRNGRG